MIGTKTAQKPQAGSQAEKATFAAKFDAMMDSLESLYIGNNQSGRLKFREAWPLLAERVFGSELMGFDEHGVTDRERRAVLEDEAEGKRLALIDEILTIRVMSVKNSMLEIDFIKSTMQKYGRDFAALIYSETLMNKFMPAPAEAKQATPVADKPVAAPISPQAPEKIKDVAPISTGVPKAAPTVVLRHVFNALALKTAG